VIELAPHELWKYDVNKHEARLYIFMLKGYRMGTLGEMQSLIDAIREVDHEMWDAWTLDAINSDAIPDDETGTAIPLRDIT
jgi:hypothetical protein